MMSSLTYRTLSYNFDSGLTRSVVGRVNIQTDEHNYMNYPNGVISVSSDIFVN